jgi:hypothetical protein
MWMIGTEGNQFSVVDLLQLSGVLSCGKNCVLINGLLASLCFTDSQGSVSIGTIIH